MCKILIFALFGCFALIGARPSYLHTSAVLPTYEHHLEYAPTIVGHTAYSLPTAISHQSQTIVHEKRPYLRPIVGHTPILKTAYPAYVESTALYGLPTAAYAPGIGSYGSYGDYGSYGSYGGLHSGLVSSPWIK